MQPAALREAQEETGLDDLSPWPDGTATGPQLAYIDELGDLPAPNALIPIAVYLARSGGAFKDEEERGEVHPVALPGQHLGSLLWCERYLPAAGSTGAR